MIKTNNNYFCDICKTEMTKEQYLKKIKPLVSLIKVLFTKHGIESTVACNGCIKSFKEWVTNRKIKETYKIDREFYETREEAYSNTKEHDKVYFVNGKGYYVIKRKKKTSFSLW